MVECSTVFVADETRPNKELSSRMRKLQGGFSIVEPAGGWEGTLCDAVGGVSAGGRRSPVASATEQPTGPLPLTGSLRDAARVDGTNAPSPCTRAAKVTFGF